MAGKRARRLAYPPTVDGYLDWKHQSGQRFSKGTEDKYTPHIERYVAQCASESLTFEEQDSTFVEMEYFPVDDERFAERYGRSPSDAYKRSRICALKSWFDFLKRLGVVGMNPLDIVVSPRWEVDEIDWLTPEEDAALAALEKDPLEEVIWGLARLQGLRVREIATGERTETAASSRSCVPRVTCASVRE